MKVEWLELSVLKGNTPARRLYEKFGFTIIAEKRWSFILRKRIQT
jgi:ribosomal protein S18 acetylase RimI-like enzyme